MTVANTRIPYASTLIQTNDEDEETEGLDIVLHNERGYDI